MFICCNSINSNDKFPLATANHYSSPGLLCYCILIILTVTVKIQLINKTRF